MDIDRMDERVAEYLRGFRTVTPNRVAWAEMDAFQHVNNVVFFRYFENARVEFLVKIGLGRLDRADGIGGILHSTGARFRRPLRYPDIAWTGARVTAIESDRFGMEYRIVSGREAEIAAEGNAVIVSYDYRARQKAPIPADVLAAIEASRG